MSFFLRGDYLEVNSETSIFYPIASYSETEKAGLYIMWVGSKNVSSHRVMKYCKQTVAILYHLATCMYKLDIASYLGSYIATVIPNTF